MHDTPVAIEKDPLGGATPWAAMNAAGNYFKWFKTRKAAQAFLATARRPRHPTAITHIKEYGLDQPLSRSILCF